MNKSLSFFVALILLSASLVMGATNERPMLVRIDLSQQNARETIRQGNFDIATITRDGYVEIVANDDDFQKLLNAGLQPQVIHEDLVAFYQSRTPVTTTMGGFRTLSEALAYMDTLHTLYPNLTTARDSIGYTYQGRAIWMMKISEHPDSIGNKPRMFINGLIHAREPMGMEACLRYMNYLLSNYGTDSMATFLVNNREFYFVPIINADGYEYNRQNNPNGGGMYRKNRHGQGVDLNRNWGYMWGYDNNGSSPNSWAETYRGTAAFSEPETQSLRAYIDSMNFNLIMNFHSYGDYFLYPWGYASIYTPDEALFEVIGDAATAPNGFSPGTPWELLYNTNGECADWTYGETVEKPKVLGFVMEIGDSNDGFWPQVSRIPVLWGQVLPSLLYLSRIAADPYAEGPPNAPVLNAIGDIDTDSLTLTWQQTDTLNPAVAYELVQYSGLQRVTDDFELDYGYWNMYGFAWRSTRSHSGSYSLFSGSQDNYDATSRRTTSIAVGAADTLQFWTWYDTEQGFDYAYVQLSTDGGLTFINIPGSITTTYNPNNRNMGNGITGTTSAWTLAKFPLNNFAGQSVVLGFRYNTDAGTLGEGFYADDFYPIESFQHIDTLNSNIPTNFYHLSDLSEGSYYYEVRARDAQGQLSGFSNRVIAMVHPLSAVDEPNLPVSLSLNQNYPNPFNPNTTISFTIPGKTQVELSVYDVTGAKVATLMNSELAAGSYHVSFDGHDESGKPLSSGVYFYRLKADNQVLTRKMVFMK
jgi:hypothetical protein